MGPLSTVRVVELVGTGPGPFCGMVLADLGADVLRIERPGRKPRSAADARADLMNRGRPSVGVDLSSPDGAELVLDLVAQADALIDPFRPGVAERLGVGPEQCLARNPGLVFARMTGWGQTGPMAPRAGHDINYIARAGVLGLFGRAGERPVPPMNLVGDFGGGAMMCAVSILSGITHARATGTGQVVDVAMVDAAAWLATVVHTLRAMGQWRGRGENLLDTGAPFYEVYETADGRYLSVGAIEPQFFAILVEGMGIADQALLDQQNDRDRWPALKKRFAEVFLTRTRDEWMAVFDGVDACVAPVLDIDEAITDPHMRSRGTFVDVHGVVQPAPAPKFSATPAAIGAAPAVPGENTRAGLLAWGIAPDRVDALIANGTALEAE
ncbi:CaiB/BaiF CoA-transferase family protein [Nocardia abscessus]|uniref:CaiB/BaiF CoA transferase family protein n=1 Tax=Nocardia TaxID=1817 RepID=UPI001894E6B1|nr:CaiB/BaiF CoA-transferase family protein [Nocardia abscessus]MBF6207829.1 CoA transferase [Streptomyces gardneri]MBF6472606.1 CoA transferase [Nocardia abscessus]